MAYSVVKGIDYCSASGSQAMRCLQLPHKWWWNAAKDHAMQYQQYDSLKRILGTSKFVSPKMLTVVQKHQIPQADLKMLETLEILEDLGPEKFAQQIMEQHDKATH